MFNVVTPIVRPAVGYGKWRHMERWEDFYKRSSRVPPPDKYRWFLERVPAGGRLLDVGAGTGWFASMVKSYDPGMTVDAIDNEPKSIELLKNNPDVARIYCMSCDEFVSDRAYDAVWAMSSLFFLASSKLPKVLTGLRKAVKSNGLVIFNYIADMGREDADREAAPGEAMRGFSTISRQELTKAIAQAGLELERLTEGERPFGRDKIMLKVYFARCTRP